MAKSLQMVHDVDPAQAIWDKVGDLKGFELFGTQVLLGLYERPDKTKSGIILTEQTRGEDIHQGKAALVLAMGPKAFVSDANYDFAGQKCEVGDWVAAFVTDGRRVLIGKQMCRIIDDQYIRLKLPAPDVVY